MNYYLVVVLSYSIFIAAVIGLIKIRTVPPVYYPFILLSWIASINEVISYYCSKWYHSNIINNNIYALIEILLIIYQFYKWDIFERRKWFFYSLFAASILLWISDYHSVATLKNVQLVFRLWSAALIILMSLHLTVKQIIYTEGPVWKNPVFLICCGFFLLNTNIILLETFWIYAVPRYPDLPAALFRIMVYVNLIVNLHYAIAFLWIPRKPQFIQLY
jgi:hypothetical protein